MSRAGARRESARSAGTPIWVWVVYALGIMAAAIMILSGLFTLGAYLLSDDVPVGADVSVGAIVVWGALIVAALVTWVGRKRGAR